MRTKVVLVPVVVSLLSVGWTGEGELNILVIYGALPLKHELGAIVEPVAQAKRRSYLITGSFPGRRFQRVTQAEIECQIRLYTEGVLRVELKCLVSPMAFNRKPLSHGTSITIEVVGSILLADDSHHSHDGIVVGIFEAPQHRREGVLRGIEFVAGMSDACGVQRRGVGYAAPE